MKEKLAAWLWAVLGAPILAHLDKKIEYHAMVLERRLLTELALLGRATGKVDLGLNLLSANIAANHSNLSRDVDAVHIELGRQANNREFEAVHFAAEKLVLDRDFWKQARVEARITAVMDWAKIYLVKNNWAVPDDQKLRTLVCAKLEQIVERKVGPTQ